MMRWGYRFGQFLMRTRAGDAAVARETAQAALPGAAYELFQEMSPGDQVHAVCVFRAVGAARGASVDLLQAALLHDVGKARASLTLPRRALIVFLESLGGGLLERLASPDPKSWRYPFYVHVHHAELGALRCREAGCSPLTVALVRNHKAPVDDVVADAELKEGLVALKQADDTC